MSSPWTPPRQVAAPLLYAAAKRLAPIGTGTFPVPEGTRCALSGTLLDGLGATFVPERGFTAAFLMADERSNVVHPDVLATFRDPGSLSGHTASGCVTADRFIRLLSNRERTLFLMDPPEPPFAVALVMAQRQHVWWMARTSYDRDHIAVQFGHRRFVIDRPKAIEAARAILAYEDASAERLGKLVEPILRLERELKSGDVGRMSDRFMGDRSEEADALRAVVFDLSVGDLWAAMQLRAGARETKTETPEAASSAYLKD